jgi:hypothetical protein
MKGQRAALHRNISARHNGFDCFSSPPSSSFGGFGATLSGRAVFLCKIRGFSAFLVIPA